MKERSYNEMQPINNRAVKRQRKEERTTPIDWETLFATTPTVDLRKETVKEEDWVW